ncbi:MAG TPA: endolytic transglycosylase MltG [Vicinamibacterales bacterium]|nr:endolytic transglycosylase MltG [Vicinamibacterales bacterium]
MKRLIAALIVLLLIAAAVAAAWIWTGVNRPYKGYSGVEQFVEIAPGAPPGRIGRALVQSGVVRDIPTVRAAILLTHQGRHLQAGEYRFDHPMSARDVIEKIARGEVYLRPLTFPEGLTLRQMAALFESKGFGKAGDFVAAASDTSSIRAIDPQATDLEGYLFPDTYRLPRTVTAAQLVGRMVANFNKALTPDVRQAAAAHGLTIRGLVTLASIVEKETARPDERPLVAAVYSNRLRIGMALQCDPTVIYALARADQYNGNLTRANLQVDSPYNTYRYPGLPPGPIASPGRASLVAAANPADVPYLYFVSRNDGSHVFATTLAEHNRNVQQYQIKYFHDKHLGR